MRRILLLILIGLIFSCSNKHESNVHASKYLVIDTNLLLKDYRNVKHWSNLSDYYGVYHFSKNITGIGFETLSGNNKSLLDSLYEIGTFQDKSVNDVILDTTGNYIIHYSKKLSDLILSNDTSKTFYIYCTKGMARATIEKVLYGTTDCTSVLILQLSPINTQQFGQPVIASKKLLEIAFKLNPKIQKAVSEYKMLVNKKPGYKDSMSSKQFAYNPRLFFTYADDFKWFDANAGSKCLFPSREVYDVSGNSARLNWSSSLDLYGIPCD